MDLSNILTDLMEILTKVYKIFSEDFVSEPMWGHFNTSSSLYIFISKLNALRTSSAFYNENQVFVYLLIINKRQS